jgi:hypothetical protein
MAELSAVVSKRKGGFKLKSDNWIKVSASGVFREKQLIARLERACGLLQGWVGGIWRDLERPGTERPTCCTSQGAASLALRTGESVRHLLKRTTQSHKKGGD